MSTPVITDKWAGTFDCGTCRRKRLVAAEFSKKALEKYRKTGRALKCKACVLSMETSERKAASERASLSSKSNQSQLQSQSQFKAQPAILCASCNQILPPTSFTKNQYLKGPSKGRCQPCVETSLQEEAIKSSQSKQDKIDAAKTKLAQAKTPMEKLKAESQLAAIEGEYVTGLKPIKMGRGRGRGRGSGRGRGRTQTQTPIQTKGRGQTKKRGSIS